MLLPPGLDNMRMYKINLIGQLGQALLSSSIITTQAKYLCPLKGFGGIVVYTKMHKINDYWLSTITY